MEDRLNSILLDGEVIRWCGRPAPFQLLSLPLRNWLIATWAGVGLALTAAVLALLSFCSRTGGYTADSGIFFVAVVSIPLMIAARPFFDRRCLMENTVYAITNYRAISMVGGDVMYIPLSSKLKTAITSRCGHCGNLQFGDAVNVAPQNELSTAVLGVRFDENPHVPGMLFYHISQPDTLLRYLA